MKKDVPTWAMKKAGPGDFAAVGAAQQHSTLRITWPEAKALREQARLYGWPAPRFNFERAFIAKMLETEANFALAIDSSGVELSIPRQDVTISPEQLGQLDALYAERAESGQPVGWGTLVEELREIRRAVEAGVVVTVEGPRTLHTWQGFYSWAHGRYHMLEDGADKWIGNDD